MTYKYRDIAPDPLTYEILKGQYHGDLMSFQKPKGVTSRFVQLENIGYYKYRDIAPLTYEILKELCHDI